MDWNGNGKYDVEDDFITFSLLSESGKRAGGSCCLLPCLFVFIIVGCIIAIIV